MHRLLFLTFASSSSCSSARSLFHPPLVLSFFLRASPFSLSFSSLLLLRSDPPSPLIVLSTHTKARGVREKIRSAGQKWNESRRDETRKRRDSRGHLPESISWRFREACISVSGRTGCIGGDHDVPWRERDQARRDSEKRGSLVVIRAW